VDTGRRALQDEVDHLTQEGSRVVQTSEFNGTKLFMGGSDLTFQVGPNAHNTNQITIPSVNLATPGGGSAAEYNAAQAVTDAMTGANKTAAIINATNKLTSLIGPFGFSTPSNYHYVIGATFVIAGSSASAIHNIPELEAAYQTINAAVISGGATPAQVQAAAQSKADTYKPVSGSSGLNSYNDDINAVNTITISNQTAAISAINSMNEDLNLINKNRATFGAIQNRFESVIRNAENTAENLSASRSRIEDTDFAQETSKLVKLQILESVGVSILSQANTLPQAALSLLAN